MPYKSELKYAENPKGWNKEGDVFSRLEILNLVYGLYANNKDIILAAGVSDDDELNKVRELLKKGKSVIITQPDEEVYEDLRKKLKDYPKAKIIKDYTFNIGKYLPEKSLDYAILLNIINWIPTKLLEMLKGLTKVLKSDGYVIISFYVHLNPNAPEIKYIIDTPKEFLNLVDKLGKFIAYYSDKNGILACYVIDARNLNRLYKEVEGKYRELEREIRFYHSN
ncbi:MAG: hypothetical protein QW197_02140 [Candidatus Aenigmatarchaeota archaeon]